MGETGVLVEHQGLDNQGLAIGHDGDDRLSSLGHLAQGGHRYGLDRAADRGDQGLELTLLLGFAQGVAPGGRQALGLSPFLGGLADELLGQLGAVAGQRGDLGLSLVQPAGLD